jgi:hypothetical protein
MPSLGHQPADVFMVSLFEAAALAFYDATGKHTDDAGTLNNLARLIALNTRVFARASDGEDYSLVMPTEIDEGQFQLGGAYLDFHDGRPPLNNLTILRRELAKVFDEIRDIIRGPRVKARRKDQNS